METDATKSDTILCKKCRTGDQSEPFNWCTECKESLCEDCTIDHMICEPTMEHTVIPKQAPAKSETSSIQAEILSGLQAEVEVPEIMFERSVDIMSTRGNVVVTDMVSVEYEKLLLCDSLSKRVMVYHEVGDHLMDIMMEGNPLNIAVIPETLTAVVKFRYQNAVQYIDTKNKTPGKVVKLQTKIDGRGIAATKDYLLVGSVAEVYVLNFEGELTKTIKLPILEWNKPLYIQPSHFDSFYYTTRSEVCFSRADGSHVFHVRPNNLVSPQKMVTDLHGFLYVSDVVTNKVVRLTPYGHFVDVKVGGGTIKKPYAICFNAEKTLLFVANNLGRDLRLFRIKYKEEI